jgi:hypothetical protein
MCFGKAILLRKAIKRAYAWAFPGQEALSSPIVLTLLCARAESGISIQENLKSIFSAVAR